MSKKRGLFVLIGGILFLGIGIGFLVKAIIHNHEYNKFVDRGVPRLSIILHDVSLEDINNGSKETKYEGNKLTVYNNGGIQNYDEVEVKGRGNGTWTQEKKPYQIRFNKKVDLFGMGKARKWCLLANAVDGSNLRTEIAFSIIDMLKMEYAMKGEFVELYVNDEYQGLYYLTHVVEIGKSTVDLKDSMGILMELDNLYWRTENYRKSQDGDILVIKDVKTNDLLDASADAFMKSYNEFEMAVKNKDYQKISEIIDVDSFAKYYIVSEFSVNPDAYWTSFYFYKDGGKDKIHAGPAWDFDLTFGNRSWSNWLGEVFYSPTETMIRRRELLTEEEYSEMDLADWFSPSQSLSRMMFRLVEIPEFMEKIKTIFKERLSGKKDELIGMIWTASENIRIAAEADDVLWNETYTQDEINDVVKWVEKRFDYFEQVYGDNDVKKHLP